MRFYHIFSKNCDEEGVVLQWTRKLRVSIHQGASRKGRPGQ